jgi:tRNA A-37 threonylcarbamoyl transferase component Bud32
MSDAAIVHPSAQQLSAFGLGKLSEAEAEAVARHLGDCPDCLQAVQRVAPDSFLGRVKQVRPGGGTALPRKAPPPQGASPPGKRRAAPPALPPELQKHPKFRVVRALGQGGMGAVYLAEHRVMERPVALKVVNRALLDNDEALARFRNEIKAAGRLKHDNIVAAYDAEQAGDLHLLVMEYVEGRSLAQLVEKQGALAVADACRFAQQAALGLQHAFERGMVHRDIKPHNLMVTPEGRVKILDFGLARLASERPRRGAVTVIGAYMGTPEYMAPEQALDARSADIRADVYSLGCTLYCLLAGRPPFAGETPVQQFEAHQHEEAAPLHEVRPDVPAGLSALVARMMSKDPAARYQTPIEVARALAPFARRQAAAAGTVLPLREGAAGSDRGTMRGTDTSKLPAPPRGAPSPGRPKGAASGLPVAGRATQGTGQQRAGRSVPAAGTMAVRGSGGGGRSGNRSRLVLAAGGAGMAALAGIIIIIVVTRESPKPAGPAGPVAAPSTGRDREGSATRPSARSTEAPTERGGDKPAGPGAPVGSGTPPAPATPVKPVRIVRSALKDGGGFREGNDGWTTRNHDETPDATTPVEVKEFQGFYYLSARDVSGAKEWGWHAPEKYHGDHSDKFGRLLKYSLWAERVGHVPWTDWWVRITGVDEALFVDGSSMRKPVAGQPEEYSIRLDNQHGWKKWTKTGGIVGPATDEDIKRVLANVTDLRIKGEFYSSGVEGHLHWVIFGEDE